jgi:hypothetical protein
MFAVSHVKSCAWGLKLLFNDLFCLVIAERYVHLEFLESEHPTNGEIEVDNSYIETRVYLTGPICSLRNPSEELKGPYWRCGGQSRSPVSSIIIPPSSADSTSDVSASHRTVSRSSSSCSVRVHCARFFFKYFLRSAIFVLC